VGNNGNVSDNGGHVLIFKGAKIGFFWEFASIRATYMREKKLKHTNGIRCQD
jgi:hypothetical protein